MHFGVKLLLLVRQEQDFDVRIRGTARVHGHEVCSLKDANCELCTQEQWGMGMGMGVTQLYQTEIQGL